MKVLVYSDVHGNLSAFETMLKKAGSIDKYVCLGDLVNYGPWSNECVDLALSLPNSIIVMGNHEEAYINSFYPGNNDLVQTFFSVTYPGFQRISEIKKFIENYKLDQFICLHTIENQYIYPDTKVQLHADYLIGHSHHQFTYLNNDHVLYNVGSVGQNRKYINVCNFVIYDSENKKITLENVIYPVEKLIKEMKLRKYPSECINYYESKSFA